MKIQLIISILIVGLTGSVIAQPDMLVGQSNRSELQSSEMKSHFYEEYQNYTPCSQIINALRNKIYNYEITIVLATWCHDSQQQVPRFFKILDELDYNTNNVSIFAVDKNKMAGDFDIANLNIELVPTFIFYHNDKEVGRIIESPVNVLEKDIYKIVSSN